jgi:hypothetical protein
MRPKRFGKKPVSSNPEKYRRVTRVTPRIKEIAAGFKGTNAEKAEQIIKFVIKQRPINLFYEYPNKKTIFKKNADRLAAKREYADVLHCNERCTLALALLNASGIPSWMVRQINLAKGLENLEFHDYIETFIGGKVHTISFNRKFGSIHPGSVEETIFHTNSFFYRGADSKQIGGIDSMEKFEKFKKNFAKNLLKNVNKDSSRIKILVENGIIPKEALKQIKVV